MNEKLQVSQYVVVETHDGKQVGGKVLFHTPKALDILADGGGRVTLLKEEIQCIMDDTATTLWVA